MGVYGHLAHALRCSTSGYTTPLHPPARYTHSPADSSLLYSTSLFLFTQPFHISALFPLLERIALRTITRRRVTTTSSTAIGVRVGKLCSRPPRRIVSAETSRLNISRNTRAIRQRDPAPAAIVRNIVDSSSWCASASVIGLRRGCQLCGWKERHIYVPGRQLPEERR